MCTLYNVTTNHEAVRRLFALSSPNLPNSLPSGDIFPKFEAPVVRADAEGRRELASMVWGFPPPGGTGAPVVNVRNLASPFWRTWLARPEQRCLVPVDRFAEWTAAPDPTTARKRKVWFGLKGEDAAPFAFAGLWRSGPAEGEPARFAVLTTMANGFVASIHPKSMPVILARVDYDRWMEAPAREAAQLARACPSDWMTLVDA